MKKSLSLFIAFFYLVIVSGIVLQLHFCGGKISSVKIAFFDHSNTCSCGKKSMKKGCCKNQSIAFKIHGDQKIASKLIVPVDYSRSIVLHLPKNILKSLLLHCVSLSLNYHSPPPKYSNSLLILNSTFRI
jgi:hypothetical protein